MSEKSLFQTFWFKAALAAPVTGAIVTSLIITSSVYLEWNVTAMGLNSFVSIFKIPITIFGLALPFIALAASHHRSVQAAAQLKLQQEQNEFANYFKHAEEFEKYVDNLTPNREFSGIGFDVRVLHAALYPDSREGNYSLRADYHEILRDLEENADELHRSIIQQVKIGSTLFDRKELLLFLYSAYSKLTNLNPRTNTHKEALELESVSTELNELQSNLNRIFQAKNFYYAYSEFAQREREIQQLLNLTLSHVNNVIHSSTEVAELHKELSNYIGYDDKLEQYIEIMVNGKKLQSTINKLENRDGFTLSNIIGQLDKGKAKLILNKLSANALHKIAVFEGISTEPKIDSKKLVVEIVNMKYRKGTDQAQELPKALKR